MNPNKTPLAIWDRELAARPKTESKWLWQGFLAHGSITLLTSVWKSGKTTLISHLLAHRKAVGDFVGLPLLPGKSAVISEEGCDIWAERGRQQDYGGNVCFFPQPFNHVPSADEWQALLDRIADLNRDHGADLLIVDPLVHFLRAENEARTILETLLPLRTLTSLGMAVLLLHHPKKGRTLPGQVGRGHGALLGHVDIEIEMHAAGADPDTRTRRFYSPSRHADTPRHYKFELNADRAGYTVLPVDADVDLSIREDVLRYVLEDAPQKLTRHDILDEWPDDFPKPDPGTLSRWLNSAVAAKLVQIEGTGRRHDPYRYWVAAAETRWRMDPLYEHLEKQLRDLKVPYMSLREKRREVSNARAINDPV